MSKVYKPRGNHLEIHKAANADDLRIDVTEVFPDHYNENDRREIMEVEAQALYDALKDGLPDETKLVLVRLITSSGLGGEPNDEEG